MIAVTGDTRGIEALYSLSQDETVRSMSKNDYLLVLGNCGITEAHTDFHENVLMYRDLPCSVMYIDGPHDDYDLLADHPLFPWNGGMTQNISRYLVHLVRGQVFTVGGKRFLAMGGGTTPGRDETGKFYDWWPEQDIFPAEVGNALENLSQVGNRVDYVFSCECPTSWKASVKGAKTPCSEALESILAHADYGHWYFSNPEHVEIPEGRATGLSHEVVVLG